MLSLSKILILIALILSILFLVKVGGVLLLGITVTLICVALLLGWYGK